MSEKKEALVKKRIIDYYESRGISCRDFSRKTGVDETAFYRLDSEMQMKNIVKILRAYPDMDAREILLGEPSVKATPDSKTIRLLPFDAVAGHLSGNLNGDYSETIQLPQFLARGADFAIRVEGDSMTPRFQSGELLLAKKVDDSFIQWGKCYVIATKHDCVVKRLYPCKDDDNSVTCHSENTESYPDYDILKEDITGIGIVVGHIGHD